MKKFLTILGVLCLVASAACAEMDSTEVTIPVIGTNANTNRFVVNGSLAGVYVTIPTAATGDVAIAGANNGPVFYKATVVASAIYYPRIGTVGPTAGAAPITDSGSNTYLAAQFPVSEVVTCIFTGKSGTATSPTNSYKVKLIVEK